MSDKKLAYIYLTFTLSAWGSLYVVSKFVMGNIPPFTLLFLRYFISGILLLFVLKHRKTKKIEKSDYKYILFIGFAGYFLSIGAQLLGTKFSNASLASLINSMNPIFIILFAIIILKEKLTVNKIIAVTAAILGTYIIVGGTLSGQLFGISCCIFSVILWSLMSVIVKKVTIKYDPIQITTYGIIIAAICSLPVSIFEMQSNTSIVINGQIILSVLYIGVVCTALSHVLWNKSLSLIEAGKCSVFYPLQPLVSALLGWLFLNETISFRFIIGAALIIFGILFTILENNTSSQSTKEISEI